MITESLIKDYKVTMTKTESIAHVATTQYNGQHMMDDDELVGTMHF